MTRREAVFGTTGLISAILPACGTKQQEQEGVKMVDALVEEATPLPDAGDGIAEADPALDASGFVLLADVVPDVMCDPRYHSTFNFVGRRIQGYDEGIILSTRESAEALSAVSDIAVSMGFRLKVYDAYRPQMAVDMFADWAKDIDDMTMERWFYPDVDKRNLFDFGYIDYRSGHTRGSTFDITLFDMGTGRDLDMGGGFDFFGELSHPDYQGITDEQWNNRQLLRDLMMNGGFVPIPTEWWHFSLADEPYPDTYFDFPISMASLGR